MRWKIECKIPIIRGFMASFRVLHQYGSVAKNKKVNISVEGGGL